MTIATSDERRTFREAISAACLADEAASAERLVRQAHAVLAGREDAIEARAAGLVEAVRREGAGLGVDVLLQEYGLSTAEGVALLCLAETLLRIPDAETIDRLIADKLVRGDWDSHLGHARSFFVNASTWALMLAGRVAAADELAERDPHEVMAELVSRLGAPVLRRAAVQATRILAHEFVLGRTIEEALARARKMEERGLLLSYDMLGEAAKTAGDARFFLDAYHEAIRAVGSARAGRAVDAGPGVSIKLSALHPRCEFSQQRRVMAELAPRLHALVLAAREAKIAITIDAEEADRLELMLDLVETVFADPALGDWQGFGVAVQAYQKRAPFVIDWLADLARRHGRRIGVRLVKGAYWDTEIRRAQARGLSGYPVFTRKATTDVSYLACADRLFANADALYPMFATHNAHTAAAVTEMAAGRPFEFQRLYGMGEALYARILTEDPGRRVRVYAPVGSYEHLLSYLLRRLLENGANASFVHRLTDARIPVAEIVADPVARTAAVKPKANPRIPLPGDLFAPGRKNSAGIDLGNPLECAPLLAAIEEEAARGWRAAPIVSGAEGAGVGQEIRFPADRRRIVGHVIEASDRDIDEALGAAHTAAASWDATPADERAAILERAAEALERERPLLMALSVFEGGRTIADALSELREAVDFCRYYALEARRLFERPEIYRGITGERNEVSLHGRGVFLCISPWNFPLAIFTGQVAAALAAGNAVIAKPAEETPLAAAQIVRLMHEAGVSSQALHLLPGDGPRIGGRILADPRLSGVAFTGSTETAGAINRRLAEREGPILPLIAETGGQNAMIVDSTALREQVADDVLASAFGSAGQRCSSLRVLFIQEDIADRMLDTLIGAMQERKIGDPSDLATDIGPVINGQAQEMLRGHAERMRRLALKVWTTDLPPEAEHGTFVAPHIFEIDRIDHLEREVFGPMLHVIRFARDRLDDVIAAINRTGFGLTFGVQSRIDGTSRRLASLVRTGNTYVNRDMIGAVVGVQPFGGEGQSGTGPKAGGPRYLPRFAVERTVTVNTAAFGDIALMAESE